MEDKMIKNEIKRLIASVAPYDLLEKKHIEDACDWISDDKNIFRIKKDAIPPKHLVSYAVVIDPREKKILLFDHKKANLMLPSGGHININEMPLAAAKRELKEELRLSLDIYKLDNNKPEKPFFVTVTQTVGISTPHTDVSLWFLFEEDSTKPFKSSSDEYDKEFYNFHWLSFNEVLSSPIKLFDPCMHRVIKKIYLSILPILP